MAIRHFRRTRAPERGNPLLPDLILDAALNKAVIGPGRESLAPLAGACIASRDGPMPVTLPATMAIATSSPPDAQSETIRNHAAFIWSVADLLRGDYKQSEYGKVILPLTVIRRLDCVLEPTKQAVLAKYKQLSGKVKNVEPASNRWLASSSTTPAPLTFTKLLDDPSNIADSLHLYIGGFSEAAKDVIDKFDFGIQIDRLRRANLLYQVIGKFADIDLHPDAVSNIEMGYLYEELIRKFSELSNETAGEHFTPREVIRLMVNLLFIDDADDVLTKPGIVKTLCDPACGTGGMLSVAEDHLRTLNPQARLEVFGQELNAETYAVCRSDMMLKGQDASHIAYGNSFSEDHHEGERFDYLLANPQGETMPVVIDARYFFGEPVSNATVKYRVYHSPHYWWDEEGGYDDGCGEGSDQHDLGYDAAQQSEQTGKLDANGKLTIHVPTQYVADLKSPNDQDYTVEAAVTDQANREITGRGRFLATRGTFRIHVEPVSYAIRVGDSALLNVTAVDYDNHPVQTQVHLQLVTHKYVKGKTQTTPGAATDVTTDASGRAQATIPVAAAGNAEVEATATTPEKRVVFDSTYLWVMGGNEEGWGGESRAVQIISDKKSYAPGDTAHLSILSNVDISTPW